VLCIIRLPSLNLAQYSPLGQISQTDFGPSGSQMDRTET
jgi:hypothetical protein